MKSSMKIAFVYMVSIIGAGFISGQELLKFFSVYGGKGFFGILIAGLLFSITGAFILERVRLKGLTTFKQYLNSLMPRSMAFFYNELVSVFVLAAFYIMVAGMADQLYSITNYSKPVMAFIFSLLCFFISFAGIKFIANISTYLSPFMIFSLIITGGWLLIEKQFAVSVFADFSEIIHMATDNWIYSSVIYVSYNTLLSAMLLCSLYPLLKTRKDAYLGGVVGGMLLMMVAFLINSVLYNYFIDIRFAVFMRNFYYFLWT